MEPLRTARRDYARTHINVHERTRWPAWYSARLGKSKLTVSRSTSGPLPSHSGPLLRHSYPATLPPPTGALFASVVHRLRAMGCPCPLPVQLNWDTAISGHENVIGQTWRFGCPVMHNVRVPSQWWVWNPFSAGWCLSRVRAPSLDACPIGHKKGRLLL